MVPSVTGPSAEIADDDLADLLGLVPAAGGVCHLGVRRDALPSKKRFSEGRLGGRWGG